MPYNYLIRENKCKLRIRGICTNSWLEYLQGRQWFYWLYRALLYAFERICGQAPSSPPCIRVKHRFSPANKCDYIVNWDELIMLKEAIAVCYAVHLPHTRTNNRLLTQRRTKRWKRMQLFQIWLPHSRNFSGTRGHWQLSSSSRVCRPTPDSGSSDLVLRLKLSCVTYRTDHISHVLRNTGTGSLKSSGLWISNVRTPSLNSHSDQPRQTQSLPSLCLKSRLASPTLTSTDRASHHTPDRVTRLSHTVTLGCFMPGGFYAKTQINLPICI